MSRAPVPARSRVPSRRTAARVVRLSTASTALTVFFGLGAAPAPAGASPLGPLGTQQLDSGAAHACAVGGPPTVRWSGLANPILSDRSAGVKDQALVWVNGRWHALVSFVTHDRALPDGVRWDVASATSPDLVHWSTVVPWAAQPGALGVASPDVVRDRAGQFVVTYQSDPGGSPPRTTQARLFYRTSADFQHWSAPHPLAQQLAPLAGDRMIDGALVVTGHQLLVGFKFSSPSQPDVFEIARSTSGQLRGPWVLVGRPDITVNGGTVENYEFVRLAGRWRLMATSDNLDQPWLFTLTGDPGRAQGWLRWTAGYQLEVPGQAFDSGPGLSSVGFEHANSAYLCSTGSSAGREIYLFYAGSRELTQFGGWGHAAIGVARSTDLVHWQVPPG